MFGLAKLASNLVDTVYKKLCEDYPEDCLDWVKDADWELQEIPLSEINMSRRPGGRNMDKVKNIAKAVQAGESMGPVFLVKQSNGTYQIADGYHRTLGFQRAGKEKIKAYVADTGADDGPWDTEMHAKKLNVEPGKKANEMNMGLAKLARQVEQENVPAPNARSQQTIKMQKAKDFQRGQQAIRSGGVMTSGVSGNMKDVASLVGRGMSRFASEFVDLRFMDIPLEKTAGIQNYSNDQMSREELLNAVSKKQDKKGWYVYTHRARSKSYPSIDEIPMKDLKFVESTG